MLKRASCLQYLVYLHAHRRMENLAKTLYYDRNAGLCPFQKQHNLSKY